jgi:hypothetical protein
MEMRTRLEHRVYFAVVEQFYPVSGTAGKLLTLSRHDAHNGFFFGKAPESGEVL